MCLKNKVRLPGEPESRVRKVGKHGFGIGLARSGLRTGLVRIGIVGLAAGIRLRRKLGLRRAGLLGLLRPARNAQKGGKPPEWEMYSDFLHNSHSDRFLPRGF